MNGLAFVIAFLGFGSAVKIAARPGRLLLLSLLIAFWLPFPLHAQPGQSCTSEQKCCGPYDDLGGCLGQCRPKGAYCHWRPAVENCNSATHLCIYLTSINASGFDNTEPDNPEAWNINFLVAGKSRTTVLHVYPGMDNKKEPRLYSCVLKNSVPFDVLIRGYEDDFFNDDPIPTVTLRVSSGCSDAAFAAPDYVSDGLFQDADYKDTMFGYTVTSRRAIYTFHADYLIISPNHEPNGPHYRKCKFGEKCCGRILHDGKCEGQCLEKKYACR